MTSMTTYRGEMRAPQHRARPRRMIHERMGTLSSAPMGFPHAGQWDPGRTTLISRGTRWTTTFTKLAHIAPQANAKTRMTARGRAISFSVIGRASRA